VEGAIACYRKAIALDPRNASAHANLGNALADKGEVEGAIACYRKAIALDPKLALAHYNLGNALYARKDVAGAIACFRKAIAANPKLAPAHYNLGIALHAQKDVEGAVASLRKAIAADPTFAHASVALGEVLMQQGQFAQARSATRRCLKRLSPDHPLRQPAARLLQQCEWLLALEERLTAVLKGKAEPKDAAERLNLAGLAQQPYKREYAAAARLYAEAFADNKTSGDLMALHRYNAACAAALAAAGKGEGAGKWEDKERARLRRQALEWLQADLPRWTKALDKEDPRIKAAVRQQMRHWQTDPDLASVRDKETLAKLPEDERKAWRKLWADVAALLKRAKAKEPPRKRPQRRHQRRRLLDEQG
jgi:tetratricopeptide (TPR) repeat protein